MSFKLMQLLPSLNKVILSYLVLTNATEIGKKNTINPKNLSNKIIKSSIN